MPSLWASLWARLRRDARALVVMVLVLPFAAPVLLGPATALILHAVGGEVEHQCACGMKRGTCGCSECAQIEHDRRESKAAVHYVALKSSCDDDDGGPGLGTVPEATPPASFVVHSVVFSERALPLDPEDLDSSDPPKPETPPPRTFVA